jgi:GrpB-like predicted nucleotidyltransferase (UPF0157 family)
MAHDHGNTGSVPTEPIMTSMRSSSNVGLKDGIVKLAPHSKTWVRKFNAEKKRLALKLAPRRYRIEHIGSTAVPDLEAKPIIDIAILIPSFRTLKTWIAQLESAGYLYKGEYGLPGRHFFTRGSPAIQHLHLVTPSSTHWNNWLLFRDFLRTHPIAANCYNRQKRKLACQFPDNRTAYTRAKTPIVNKLVRAAQAWRIHP